MFHGVVTVRNCSLNTFPFGHRNEPVWAVWYAPAINDPKAASTNIAADRTVCTHESGWLIEETSEIFKMSVYSLHPLINLILCNTVHVTLSFWLWLGILNIAKGNFSFFFYRVGVALE